MSEEEEALLKDYCEFCKEPIIALEVNLDGIVCFTCPKCNKILRDEIPIVIKSKPLITNPPEDKKI